MDTHKICRLCKQELELIHYSKHSRTKDKLDSRCKKCVSEIKYNTNSIPKEYTIYPLDFNNKDWQVGKIAGTLMKRENKRFEVRFINNTNNISKSFPFSKYNTIDEAKIAAEQWQIDKSNELGLTRNKIRIIDNDTIEVQIGSEFIMKTDLKFSDICQKYTLSLSKSCSKTDSDNYATFSINNKLISFHKYITNYHMTDHINRNTLDNTLCNLRETTHKLNNNNRGILKNKRDNKEHVLGVRYVSRDNSWQARIKQNNKEYTKSFSVKKFGNDGAKKLAIETRKQFNELYNCNNS
jgi:hypothetical protein